MSGPSQIPRADDAAGQAKSPPTQVSPRPAAPSAAGLFALLVMANLAVGLWTWITFAGHPALLALATLAWTFGLRHAIDADHIAAIDNIVRKLMNGGRRPVDVGLWFALGHSTLVAAGTIILVTGIARSRAGIGPLPDWMAKLGGAVSAGFLILIGIWNLFALRRVLFGGARDATKRDTGPGGGLLMMALRPLVGAVTRPWHGYFIGLLFALGFDTATEIGVVGISATQAAGGLPPAVVLVFPTLFAAGMTLVDTLDSMFMVSAYGLAVTGSAGNRRYSLAITGISATMALGVGGLEAVGLIGEHWGLTGAPWDVIARANASPTALGLAVVGLCALVWAATVLGVRLKPR